MSSVPVQTFTPHKFAHLPAKDELVAEFKGKSLNELRTPAMVIDRYLFRRNCAKMIWSSKRWGACFRAHLKTHKTAEGTRMQLDTSAGQTTAIVVSTLMEAWEVVNAGLVADGTVQDILYGLPLALNKVHDLSKLSEEVNRQGGVIRVLIDHPKQVDFLEDLEKVRGRRWSAFVKIDGGQKRAGIASDTPFFKKFLTKALTSGVISVYGFYCHAGNAYASTSLDDATNFLSAEVEVVNNAAKCAHKIIAERQAPKRQFVLSVGSTPTAHAANGETKEKLQSLLHGSLELHAGNYPMLDLQQLHTGLVQRDRIAQKVLATVISYYPGRGEDGGDEALCDAGAIALSKDTGPSGSFGEVIGKRWKIGRISQEHGILTRHGGEGDELEIGSVIEIVGQHACLIAAAYPWYYIVDSEGDSEEGSEGKGAKTVVDVWVPWKGW